MRSKIFSIRVRAEHEYVPQCGVDWPGEMAGPVLGFHAAKEMLNSILYIPAIEWKIENVYPLSRRQDFELRIPGTDKRRHWVLEQVISRDEIPRDHDAMHRSPLSLRNVDFAIFAHFASTGCWGDGDSIRKLEEIFEWRVSHGHYISKPSIQLELPAYIDWYEGLPAPLRVD